MALSIALSGVLEQKLYSEAKKRQLTPEQVIVDILAHALADDVTSSVSEVVARIKATPPNPAMITQPQGSLVEALQSGPTDPDFDLATWEREWAMAEEELRCILKTGSVNK